MNERERVEARKGQCVARRDHGCWIIDTQILGWPHAIHMDDCDTCWAFGPPTAEADGFRRSLAAHVVRSAVLTIERKHPKVIEAIIDRHSTPDEALARWAILDAVKERRREEQVVLWPVFMLRGVILIGIRWEGVPWPKRPVYALAAAAVASCRAARRTWKDMGHTGCGCVRAWKQAYRRLQK